MPGFGERIIERFAVDRPAECRRRVFEQLYLRDDAGGGDQVGERAWFQLGYKACAGFLAGSYVKSSRDIAALRAEPCQLHLGSQAAPDGRAFDWPHRVRYYQ